MHVIPEVWFVVGPEGLLKTEYYITFLAHQHRLWVGTGVSLSLLLDDAIREGSNGCIYDTVQYMYHPTHLHHLIWCAQEKFFNVQYWEFQYQCSMFPILILGIWQYWKYITNIGIDHIPNINIGNIEQLPIENFFLWWLDRKLLQRFAKFSMLCSMHTDSHVCSYNCMMIHCIGHKILQK